MSQPIIITSGYNGYGRNCDQPASGFMVQRNPDHVSVTGVTLTGQMSKIGIAISFRNLPDVIHALQAAYSEHYVEVGCGELTPTVPRVRARRRPAAEKAAKQVAGDGVHRRNGVAH